MELDCIAALRAEELLSVAWRDLANPQLTPFEPREARNQVNQYGAELRHHLPLIEGAPPLPNTIAGRKHFWGSEVPNPCIAIADINQR
jgi:hypothetical protein